MMRGLTRDSWRTGCQVDDAGSPTNGAFRGHYDAQVSRGDGGLPVDLFGNLYVCGSLIDLLGPCH